MLSDVTVVIRALSERTRDTCKRLASSEVPDASIFTIQERPFSNAVKKTFEIGVREGKAWTLALDADILLRQNAIKDLVNQAESLPDHFFMIQGRVLDKLFCFSRNGGPHLFRTSLLKTALPLVPEQSEGLRPEGETVKRMIKLGFHRYKGVGVYGLHDFEQYYEDIFRTGFFYGIKFRKLTNFFLNEWANRLANDADYLIARLGFALGLSYSASDVPNLEFLRNLSTTFLTHFNIDEKPLPVSELDVNDVLKKFQKSAEGLSIEEREHDFIMRSDVVMARNRISVLRRIGRMLERMGRRLSASRYA